MRTSLMLTLAGAVLASAFLLPTPAAATDARGAIRGCDKNPACKFIVNNDGSVDLNVKQADGKSDIVSCPPRGACSCQTCRTTTGKGGKVDPAHVLNASSTAATKPETNPKGTVVRDHRGTMGAPQGGVTADQGKSKQQPRVATVRGPLGGDKNKGGFNGTQGSGNKGQNNGPTIRDHRKGK